MHIAIPTETLIAAAPTDQEAAAAVASPQLAEQPEIDLTAELEELDEELAQEQISEESEESEGDAFDELNAMIAEARREKELKKRREQLERQAKGYGKKLTQEQLEELENLKAAAEVARWAGHSAYAHIVHRYCECGSFQAHFQGWYLYQERDDGKGRRLVKSDSHNDLPAWQYLTREETVWCSNCAPEGLPEAGLGDCDMLEVLGEPEQLEEGTENE